MNRSRRENFGDKTYSSVTTRILRLHDQILVLERNADSLRCYSGIIGFHNIVQVPLVVAQLLDHDLAIAVALVQPLPNAHNLALEDLACGDLAEDLDDVLGDSGGRSALSGQRDGTAQTPG